MNEEDLRVQRTRHLLKNALIDLIEERGYESLTIRDLTNRAEVGYKTFFRHYPSKDALLQAFVTEVVDGLRTLLLAPSAPDAPLHNTRLAVQYAQENKMVFLAVVRSPASDQLLAPITQLTMEEGIGSFSGSGLPDKLVAHHFGASLLHLVTWWLEEGEGISAEEMTDYIKRLLIDSLGRLAVAGDGAM